MARRTQAEKLLREAIENWRAADMELDALLLSLMKSIYGHKGNGLMAAGVALSFVEDIALMNKALGRIEARYGDAVARLDDIWLQQQQKKNLPNQFRLKERTE